MARALSLANLMDNQVGGRRNLIINGAMEVWQRGTLFGVGTNLYTADRWRIDNGSGVRSTDSPDDFNYSLEVYRALPGDNAVIRQAIELPSAGKGGIFRSGQTFTLSFWIKAEYPEEPINIFIASSTGVGGTTTTHVNDTSTGLATPSQWTRYTYTYTQASNVGGSDTCYNIVPYVYQPLGFVYFTGIQLELGDTATPFEHRSYAEELALCQRYYFRPNDNVVQDDGSAGLKSALSASAYAFNSTFSFPVKMRASPSVTIDHTNTVYDGSSSNLIINPNPDGYITRVTAVANSTYRCYNWFATFNAEL